MASAKEFVAKHGLAIGSPSTVVFNSSGVLQASALSGATISITSVDIDGGTDIGADLVDADLLLVDDGAGGTNRKSELSRVKKYIYSAVSGDATISDTGALTIAATSVENSMLAGSIANDKLSNSTVSFGGVSLALGASDATPAFDLSDATNYPTSSLSGTITNTQLAGSIANSKLTNSTITVTDGSNSTATALGGTITFAGTANETTVSESSGTVTVGLPDNVTLASNLNVGKNVVISGNLTVSGTQTVIDTNTLNIGDNIITLNSDETGTPSQNAGIEVERGTGTNVQLRWNETADKWQITNDGSSYQNLGESELVNDTSPQLGGDLDLNSSNITGTGNINITGTSTISGLSSLSGAQFDGNVTPTSGQGVEIFAPDTSTGQIQSFDRNNSNFDKLIIKGDPVEIYDGSTKRIETTNAGATVSGTLTATAFSGDGSALTGVSGGDVVDDTTPQLGGTLDVNSQLINFGDSSGATDDRLNFGASQDLSIYHSGSASFIENNTGILNIVSADDSDVRIKGSAGIMAFFEDGAGVTLQYNGSQKFETTNAGINVTGTVEFDGLSGTGSVSVTDILDEDNMSSNSATALATQQSIKAYVDSNSGASVSNGSNDRILTSTGGNGIQAESDFQFDGTNVFIPNEIRHLGDPDTKIGFGTDTITLTAGGVAIQTMTTSKVGLPDSKEIAFGAGDDMTLMHDGTNSEIRNRTGELQVRANTVKLKNNDNNATYLSGVNGGAIELYHNNNKKLETTSTGTTVTGTLTATTLAGTLSTAAQANITSLGTLTALAVSGATNLGTVQAETLAIENPASHHTYTITVASKTSAHPYTGQGSSNAYFLDGKESPSIILAPNMTYRFDQANSSNSGHPLRFYLEADKTTAYTTGVTTNGTPGSSGAYTQIVVTDATPPVLYYQCSSHGYMGSVASSLTEGTTDHLTEGATNLYYTNARVDTHLNTGSASSGQILSWNGSDYAWVADQTGGGGGGGSSLTVQDEGSALSTAATTLNFVGSGVTASGTGATKTITISGGGGGSSLSVKDEGSALSTAATTLNFVGAGVTASGTGAEKTITIAGGGSGITVQDEGSSLSTVGTTLNFVGSGVTASGTGATKTITISGGGGGGGSTTNFGGEFGVYTGNGSTTTFTSPLNTNHANNIIVSVDGLMQRPTTDYTISGTTVTFGTAPPVGTTVMIRSFSGELNTKASVNVQNFIGNGSNTVYKLVESVSHVNDVLVTINGIFQRPGSDYTYNTSTSNITFDEAPTLNDVISFRTFDVQARQGASVTVSDNAPTSPQSGDLWFDSTTAKMYLRYNDGSSNQWISTSTPGQQGPGVGLYANVGAFPGSGNTQGDFAIAQDTKALYIWDGAEWDRLNAGGDETPRLTTTPASTHNLDGTGSNTQITIAASDPEGFPITYSYDTNPANPNQITNVVENNGVFTLVPSTNSAHAGSFTLRLKASDGVHITSHPITVSLAFQTTFTFDTSLSVINSNYTTDNKVEANVRQHASSVTAISQQSGKLGKGYLEMKVISTTNIASLMLGVQVGTSTSEYYTGGAFLHTSTGKNWPDNSYTYGIGNTTFGVNDIIMVAYDTAAGTNGQVWFGKNGSWHRDPASTTGYDVNSDASSVGFRPAVDGSTASDVQHQIEIISHTQGAQYTIPTGWELA